MNYSDFLNQIFNTGYSSVQKQEENIVPLKSTNNNISAEKSSNSVAYANNGKILSDALRVIKNFEIQNSASSFCDDYAELKLWVPIWSPNIEKNLLYALNQGTVYKIYNNKIYIWYKDMHGFEGSGFYKLKRFSFSDYGTFNVIYILDAYDKLPE